MGTRKVRCYGFEEEVTHASIALCMKRVTRTDLKHELLFLKIFWVLGVQYMKTW